MSVPPEPLLSRADAAAVVRGLSSTSLRVAQALQPLMASLGQARRLSFVPHDGGSANGTGEAHHRSRYAESCREHLFWLFFGLLCICCVISLVVLQLINPDVVLTVLKLESIPIVSVLFTWAHIWLAVQMMFYPVKFRGLWNYQDSGYGLGWQGVVPRKAGIMAERSCELMIGRLITVEEIIDRVEMDEFFETLGKVLLECQRSVNDKLGEAHFPMLWCRIPESVKEEILAKTMETQRDSFTPIMAELRRNISSILNIKDMCVRRYVEEPTLLISLFQQVGRKEFQFIQRCGAQCGLLLGVVQMGLYRLTKDVEWMPWVLLPVSGLLIGNFTNWLAIQMIFKPTHPHVYCGGWINVQGLFLKRQKEVATELARMLTDTCVNAEQMIKYLVGSPGYEGVLEIFHRHTEKACDEVLGVCKSMVPMAVGRERWRTLKEDVIKCLLAEMPNHASSFLKYMDQACKLEETIAGRLASLPPDQFEGMLHPAFQEDEWMLILLGGVLGVVVGLAQAFVLGS